ncbi:MAG TPA: MFS transporter, partial [Dehalococcoidia bacterium]|nr:MFS transporter [Dehalococcoidia bacterium]
MARRGPPPHQHPQGEKGRGRGLSLQIKGVAMRRVSLSWMLNYSAARVGIGIHDIFYNSMANLLLHDTYGLSNALSGFLSNERSFIGSVLQPVIGGMSDRTSTPWGRRRPFIALSVPITILGFLLLMAYPPTWLVVLLFILGPLFLSLAVIPYQALLPDSVMPEQRGTV